MNGSPDREERPSVTIAGGVMAWRRTVAIDFRFNGARAAEYRRCGVVICKGTYFRSADFWNSQRWRLSAESGNGADGRGEGFCIENLWSRPAGVDGLC
jgi:hypothetical protein